MKDIKNIVFDLAGVIVNLDLERDTEALNRIGLPDFEKCIQTPDIFIPMEAYLNGLMDENVFCESIRPECNPGICDKDILDAMDEVLDIIPATRIKNIVNLRKNYKVFLLSNIYEKAWKDTVSKIEEHGFKVEDCFDRVFLSYELGIAKPDKKIYEELITATGIIPEETLYFDDSRKNVDAGNDMGFVSYIVNNNETEHAMVLAGIIDDV